jgi:hypothetical protein
MLLTNVTVTDPLVGLSAITFVGGDTDIDGELDIDETWTYSATYAVTQDDIDDGSVYNMATADSDESDPADDDNTEPLPQNPNTGNVTLFGVSVVDDQGVAVSCNQTTLAVGQSMTCTASGLAELGQYVNEGAASGISHVGDQASDTDPSHYFGANPSYTVSKSCTIEPVPQEGPATYKVTFVNTGNVLLSITADDGIGTFDLAVGETKTFQVSLPGPFSDQSTVDNKVIATGTYTDDVGNLTTIEHQDSASCTVGGRINVNKLTFFNDVQSEGYSWSFGIYLGPNDQESSDFLNNPLATANTGGGVTLLDFGNFNFDPSKTYTLCELEVPAGWATFWRIDSDNDGIPDATVIPYNPNESDDPQADLGNRCVDFTVGAGNTLVFGIENKYPGGDPRTPGYWKNWNRVTGGGQQYTADQNGGWASGFWLLEDVLDPDIGGGIYWDDILADSFFFQISAAEVAVDILDQREIGDPGTAGDGVKHSNDAAYTLAMHLLAAQLNFGAGARSCDAARDAVLAGETLLDQYDFNGVGDYLLSGDIDYQLALDLANTLDLYNNGELCVGPGVSISNPNDGTTFVEGDLSPVTIVVLVQDANEIIQVEFLVDGTSLGEDTDGSDGWTMAWDWSAAGEGSHIIEAIATNDLDEEGSADVVVVVDLVADVFMHVADLGDPLATEPGKAGKWDAFVTPLILDGGDAPVAGATVFGVWSNGKIGSCTTDATGMCGISITNNKKVLEITFTVTDVTHNTFIYDPSADFDLVPDITFEAPY